MEKKEKINFSNVKKLFVSDFASSIGFFALIAIIFADLLIN